MRYTLTPCGLTALKLISMDHLGSFISITVWGRSNKFCPPYSSTTPAVKRRKLLPLECVDVDTLARNLLCLRIDDSSEPVSDDRIAGSLLAI